MMMRLHWGAALAVAAMLLTGPLDAAPKQESKSNNPAQDQLLKLSPAERAARLARAVGNWCIGTEAFLMGVVTSGSGEGNAYWSLRCADGATWAVQVDPLAEVTAIACDDFKEVAAGKECFKKF
jgi:hypothetical protein